MTMELARIGAVVRRSGPGYEHHCEAIRALACRLYMIANAGISVINGEDAEGPIRVIEGPGPAFDETDEDQEAIDR